MPISLCVSLTLGGRSDHEISSEGDIKVVATKLPEVNAVKRSHMRSQAVTPPPASKPAASTMTLSQARQQPAPTMALSLVQQQQR
eukprot:4315086-Pleurochrysis_carterae.AAC.1